MAARSISVDERRARLAVRHRLAPSARPDDDVAGIARDLVALHASDPSTVVLSALVRMAAPEPSAVEQALYEDRTVVRVLGMRRTLFTVPVDLVSVVQASSSLAVAANERRRLEALIEEHGLADRADLWLRRIERRTLKALGELGEASAAELGARIPDLATQLTLSPGKRYEARTSLASRVLLVLGADGHIMRGRPIGRWTSSQHRWARTEDWLGAPLPVTDPPAAKVDLARRWLARFGPATVTDVKWWTGWTLGATRAALAELDTVEVDLDGGPGMVLADDLEPVASPEPWVALLPGLDPTAMGWQARDWYLPAEHRSQVMDGNGNIGPTVWVDGRVVGGWAQRKDGRVVTRLLEPVGSRQRQALTGEAERLGDVLGDIRVTPRFPAPLDRLLAS